MSSTAIICLGAPCGGIHCTNSTCLLVQDGEGLQALLLLLLSFLLCFGCLLRLMLRLQPRRLLLIQPVPRMQGVTLQPACLQDGTARCHPNQRSLAIGLAQHGLQHLRQHC